MDRKILHFIPSLSGGGAERQLVYLCSELIALGWEVHVAVLKFGPNLEKLRASKVIIHQISYRNHYDPMLLVRIYRLLVTVNPNLVQTWLPMMDILAGIMSSLFRIPWVLSERNSEKAYGDGFKSFLRRFTGRFSHSIIANSTEGANYWKNQKTKVSVIQNSVPNADIRNVIPVKKPELGIEADTRVLLFVGRLVRQKNIEEIFLAVSEIKTNLNVILLVCGVGPLLGELKTLASQLDIEKNILFLGYVDNLYALMKMADLLIVNSIYEGMPNVALEAAACGCPLVLSDIPAHREVFGQNAAWYSDSERAVFLRESLFNCLTEKMETNNKIYIARKAVQHLVPGTIANQYHKCYLNILS